MVVRQFKDRKRVFSDEEEAFIAGRVAAGTRVLQIALENGVPPQTIYNVLNRRKRLLAASETHSKTDFEQK